jgi:hypothetical protein
VVACSADWLKFSPGIGHAGMPAAGRETKFFN